MPQTTAFLLYCGMGISIATSVLISRVRTPSLLVHWTLGVVPLAVGSQPRAVAAAFTESMNAEISASLALLTSSVKTARDAI